MRTGGSENRRKHSGNLAAGGKPLLFLLRDVNWFDAYELYSFASPQKHRHGLLFLNNGKKIYGGKKQKREAQGHIDANSK